MNRARANFLSHERQLLLVDVSERTLTGTFALYLRNEFRIWDVDCEYNRDGGRVKRLLWREATTQGIGDIVLPDIVVHHRGKKANLLVIEAKKDQGFADDDRLKLQAFINDVRYQYQYAVFVRFITAGEGDIKFERIQ